MPRITRKELKKDEIAAEVSKTYEFFQQRREELIRYGTAAAIIVALAAGAFWLVQNRKQHASDELSQAVRVMFSDQGSPEPGISYTDPKFRDQAAEKQLETIAGKYSMLEEGKAARYYLGVAEQRLGKTDAAIRNLREVADKGNGNLASLAKYALAGVYASTGKTGEAEKLYQELIDHPTGAVPAAMARLTLADTLMSSKPAEAQKLYQQVTKEADPNSQTAQVVRRRTSK